MQNRYKGKNFLAKQQISKALEIFRKGFQDNHPSIQELLKKMKLKDSSID
jgi:hypothetical protein